MAAEPLSELDAYLTDLEKVQADLAQLLDEKGHALQTIDQEALGRLSPREGQLTQKLEGLLAVRRQMLKRAGPEAVRQDSLAALVAGRAGAGPADCLERMDRARESARQLRRQSWVQWIVAHRSCRFYTEMLDLIAYGGQAVPTYGEGSTATPSGGALLDAHA